jgi:hypothetical protein
MLRGSDGRFGPFLTEVTTGEFVRAAFAGPVEVHVQVDWLQLVPVISSEFDKVRTREINDSFSALCSHWMDASSYQEPSARQNAFMAVNRSGIETLAKLKGAVEDGRRVLYSPSPRDLYSQLNLCSQYLAALMCCVNAKQEVEVAAFQRSPVHHNYAQWIEKLLFDAYSHWVGVSRHGVNHDAHLYALALDEDPELALYTTPLKGVVPMEEDLRLEFLKRNINQYSRQPITINVSLERKPQMHAELALRLRDLVRWAQAVLLLVANLSRPAGGKELEVP